MSSDITCGVSSTYAAAIMATHFSILAQKIPWTEEPGELQSVGHKESDMTDLAGMQ